MALEADHECMTAIAFLIFIVAIGPLALLCGADSRRTSDRRSL
jgi:hypothetical protein